MGFLRHEVLVSLPPARAPETDTSLTRKEQHPVFGIAGGLVVLAIDTPVEVLVGILAFGDPLTSANVVDGRIHAEQRAV